MRRAWIGRLIFAVMLVAVLAYLAWGPRDRLELSDMLASVGALILGATAMVLSINPLRTVVVNAETDDLLAAELAGLIERRWAREAARRLLRRPDPLTVTWTGPGGNGDVRDLAAFFGTVPARRMVIAGAAGSGKSVAGLLLTLDLLAARRPGDTVPVLLPVASWDPEEPLESWVARRLAEEHPTLADRQRYGPDALGRLVRGGRVLPVLDGLDEMPARRRPRAIAALNIAMAGRPVVLTSRSDAFAEAVRASGMPLDGAEVVVLEPLTATAAATYLPAGQLDGERRWAPVVAELLEHPHGTVARALSTPLMVYLARMVHAEPGTDPAELMGLPTVDGIESYLLDRYLPSVYGNASARAEKWLSFLSGGASGEIAWWDLPSKVDHWRPIAGTVAGSLTGLTSALVFGLAVAAAAGSLWGLLFGGLIGLYTGVVGAVGYARLATTDTGRPRHVRVRLRDLLTPTRAGLQLGLQCMLATGAQVGGLVGVAMGFRQGGEAGVSHGVAVGLLVGIPAFLVELGVQNVTRTRDQPEEISPRTSVIGDRTACLVQGVTSALLFGLSLGAAVGVLTNPLRGVFAGLVCAVLAGLFGTVSTGLPPRFRPSGGLKWVPYTLARLWLAARRRIPLRLLRFLEEAQSLGVLHQDGAVYRFRHARVRTHLAAKALVAQGRTPGDSRAPDRLVVTG